MFFDDFVQEALHLFPNVPETKKGKIKELFKLFIAKEEGCSWIASNWVWKSLIYQLFEIEC